MATVIVQALRCTRTQIEEAGPTAHGRCSDCGAQWTGSRAAVRLALSQHTSQSQVVTWLQ